MPLRRRKALLKREFEFSNRLRYTQHRNRDGEAFFEHACRHGWEGVIAKRADSPYRHKRSTDWLRLRHPRFLVGHADSSVTLRAAVPVRIKTRFAGNGRSLAKKRNAESRRHSGSERYRTIRVAH